MEFNFLVNEQLKNRDFVRFFLSRKKKKQLAKKL